MDKIKDKYKLDYVFKWTFITEGERYSVIEKIPINFSSDYIYDFFGQIIQKDRLILFVIEYKDDVTEEDIMKQHILFQMNVHLLRLNKKSNIAIEIKNFIKKIRKSNEYVIMNKIDYGLDGIDELKIFMKEYEDNHIAYLKNPKKKDLERKEEIEMDEEPEEETVVKKDIFKKMINRTMHFTDDMFDKEDNGLIKEVWKEQQIKRQEKRDNDMMDMVVELVKK